MKKFDSLKCYVYSNEHTAFECEYLFMDIFKWGNHVMGVALRKKRTRLASGETYPLQNKLSDWKGALCL